MKFAIVCTDKECFPLALRMANAFNKFYSRKVWFILDHRSTFPSDIDFFFIWNHCGTSSNVLKKLISHPPDLKCSNCNYKFSPNQYRKYRTKIINCPECNIDSTQSNNFIYINHETENFSCQEAFDHIKEQQLNKRHWASVWTNNQMFITFLQAITYIPHIMISDECKKLDQHLIIENKNDPFTQEIIDAMSMGTVIFGNVSSYILSLYPDFPAIQIGTKSEQQVISQFYEHSNVENVQNATQAFANKHFSQEKVIKQWTFLAKFILNPKCRHNSPLKIEETDILPYPLYWGLQGGYGNVKT
jgi:hypothetical protein